MSVNGLVIGLDLCDSYTQVACGGNEKIWMFPTVIGKKKEEDGWRIGQDVYLEKLSDDGIVARGFLSYAWKKDPAAVNEFGFTGQELLQHFLKQVIAKVKQEQNTERILQLVVTLPEVNSQIMDCLLYCADYLDVPRNRFHVISYSESFLYYILSQKKEVWTNQVALFDFSKAGLWYYEMRVQRGGRQAMVTADCQQIENGLTLDLLDTFSGMKQADRMLYICGERMLSKKLFSAILLTGKGFEKTDWSSGFMKLIGKRRKVYAESHLYVKGAALKAADFVAEETAFPYIMICEGRLKATVSMEVLHDERLTQIVVAASGDSWYEAKSIMEFILDQQNELVLQVQPVDAKGIRQIKIPLEGFPPRPNRTTRIRVRVAFSDEKTMVIAIQDKGFGELFPASDAIIRKEIEI